MPKVDPFDPFLALVNARAMHLASLAIERYIRKRPALMHILFWPEMTTEALGLELHIKCLHAVRGRFPDGHGIKALYESLDAADRRDIELYLEGVFMVNPHYSDVTNRRTQIDIESILIRADEMFKRGRYWHEGKLPLADSGGRIGDAGIAPLSDAIFILLQKIHPDWWDKLKQFRIAGLDDGKQST